jgi:hypothetical protein
MNQALVERLLDTALLNDKEWAQWQKVREWKSSNLTQSNSPLTHIQVMKSKKSSDDEKEDKLLNIFKDGCE